MLYAFAPAKFVYIVLVGYGVLVHSLCFQSVSFCAVGPVPVVKHSIVNIMIITNSDYIYNILGFETITNFPSHML